MEKKLVYANYDPTNLRPDREVKINDVVSDKYGQMYYVKEFKKDIFTGKMLIGCTVAILNKNGTLNDDIVYIAPEKLGMKLEDILR